MYKIYKTNLKVFDPFYIDKSFLAEATEEVKELGLDYYHRCYDEGVGLRYKELSSQDEKIILSDYSTFSLFDFKIDAFYAPKLALENFECKQSFKDFNIAIYKGFGGAKATKELVAKSEAKEVRFSRSFKDNAYKLLHINEEVSFQAASKIVFDAYDSGADFLVVEDVYSYIMFDNHYKDLQKAMNRSLNDFYILTFSQLFSLASGKIPQSLKLNKTKAILV